MLENITRLPTDLDDIGYWEHWPTAVSDIKNYVVSEETSRRLRVYYHNSLGYMLRFMHCIDCLSCANDRMYVVTAINTNRALEINNSVLHGLYEKNTIGLIVNEEASTHFNEENYPNITRMPGVEKLLKQTPSHFLRVFTCPNNHIIHVWTNKPLEPKALFHLKHLQYNLNKKIIKDPLPFVELFYEAVLKEDINGIKTALTEFTESDYVKDLEMRRFRQCVSFNTTNRIRELNSNLESNREQIRSYEDSIMQLAARIRDVNEQIEILRNKNVDEDINILYKYLSKHPYIKEFKANDNGIIHFEYTAPLLYFNEYALDKMILNRSGIERELLQLFKEREYTLWTRCALDFETSTFRVHLRDSRDNGYFPHPHIERYHCFGNHNRAVTDSAISGDYIGAIEQISQAVLNVNFYDTCVINNMLRDLKELNTLHTWIKEETGELMTTPEVLNERRAK